MEKMELPNAWFELSFTTLLDVQGGTQPPKSNFIFEPREGYIRLLQIRDFGNKPVETYIPITNRIKTCEIDDVLIARYGASLGRICTGMEGAYNVALAKVILSEELNKKYIYFYLHTTLFQHPLSLLSRSAQNGFNKQDLESFIFPLPSLAEQKEIVRIIESHLQLVDQIKSRLDALPKILEQFRQSVLASAVTGKLTEDEKNNSRQELLINLATKIGSGSTPKGGEKNYKTEGIPLIRSMNIHFGGIKYDGLAYIDDIQAEALKNAIVYENDVLLNITGASIGRVTIAPRELNNARVNQHVSIIRTDNKKLLPKYLEIYLSSPIVQHWIESENYGATRQALTKTMIANIEIELRSLEEQTEIVKKVNLLFALADQIESKIKNAQERVNLLTQSILAKAFRGEFTAQWREDNPDLISGENSAEALLKRIEEAKKGAKKTR